jgi:hypothetical protein
VVFTLSNVNSRFPNSNRIGRWRNNLSSSWQICMDHVSTELYIRACTCLLLSLWAFVICILLSLWALSVHSLTLLPVLLATITLKSFWEGIKITQFPTSINKKNRSPKIAVIVWLRMVDVEADHSRTRWKFEIVQMGCEYQFYMDCRLGCSSRSL